MCGCSYRQHKWQQAKQAFTPTRRSLQAVTRPHLRRPRVFRRVLSLRSPCSLTGAHFRDGPAGLPTEQAGGGAPVADLGCDPAQAWLSFGERTGHETVAVQATDPASPLSATRRPIATRRALSIATGQPVEWLERGLLVAYRRGDMPAAANLGDAAASLDPGSGSWRVVFDTHAVAPAAAGERCLVFRSQEAILAVRRPSSQEGPERV